jgi:hypothetical protein
VDCVDPGVRRDDELGEPRRQRADFPAFAGMTSLVSHDVNGRTAWIPAFAGMTMLGLARVIPANAGIHPGHRASTP